jgi:hypothetical protein
MSTAQAGSVATTFLEALARRDFDGLGATFHTDGRLRALVPVALRELDGREAITERFALWNSGEDWELLETEIEDIADVLKLRWRVAETDPEDGRVVYEQTAYALVDGDGFAWMNLVCSGQRPR